MFYAVIDSNLFHEESDRGLDEHVDNQKKAKIDYPAELVQGTICESIRREVCISHELRINILHFSMLQDADVMEYAFVTAYRRKIFYKYHHLVCKLSTMMNEKKKRRIVERR
jgi:hypothetical protein